MAETGNEQTFSDLQADFTPPSAFQELAYPTMRQPTEPANVGVIDRSGAGQPPAAEPIPPAAPFGPGTPPVGATAGGRVGAAAAPPGLAQPGEAAAVPGAVPGMPGAPPAAAPRALGAPGAAAARPGAAGGAGPRGAPGSAEEMEALGTGEPGNIGYIGQRENGKDDPYLLNWDYDPTGSEHADGRPRTAAGLYMITNENWRTVGPRAGVDINAYPDVPSTRKAGDKKAREMQRAVAGVLWREQGEAPWAESAGGGQVAGGPQGGRIQQQAEQLIGQEMDLTGRLPGMIERAGKEEQESLKRQQDIYEQQSKQIDFDTQLYLHQKELQAQQQQQEADQLKSDDEKMTEWAQKTPTRQGIYAATMHAMPLLSLLVAIGGAATGAHAQTMLGALNGVVKGVNEGRENLFNDAMEVYKDKWAALKDHANNMKTVYEKFAESYGTRADGYLKAADMARQVMNDKLQVEQLKIQSSYAGIKAMEGIIGSLEKTVTAMVKLQDAAYAGQINPDTVDWMARVAFKDPAQLHMWYPNTRSDPRARAEMNAVRDRMVYLAKLAKISPNMAGNVRFITRAFANNVQQHRLGMIRLDEYVGRFQAQAEIVKDYLHSGAAPTGLGPSLNKVWNDLRRNVEGDPTFTAFENAIFGLSREHARIIAGGVNSNAQLTNAAHEMAEKLSNPNQNIEQILEAMEVMRKEVESAVYWSHKEQYDIENASNYFGLPDEPGTTGGTMTGLVPEPKKPPDVERAQGGGWQRGKTPDGRDMITSPSGKQLIDDGKGHWVDSSGKIVEH